MIKTNTTKLINYLYSGNGYSSHNANNLEQSRFFTSSSLLCFSPVVKNKGGLQKDWDDHVIDLLEYGGEYIPPKKLNKLAKRVYKDGASIDLNKIMKENCSDLEATKVGDVYLNELKDNIYDGVGYTQRNIKLRSGLKTKRGITKWVDLNSKNQVLPVPNLSFIEKFRLHRPESNGLFRILLVNKESWDQFNQYNNIKLNEFKSNTIIAKKKYISYLLNTPSNLLTSYCAKKINIYYNDIYRRQIEDNDKILTSMRYKHELNSLCHNLGKRLILHGIKYLYTQYTESFSTLDVKGITYKKSKITILDRKLELGLYLSYPEFKKIIKNKFGQLDIDDIIAYGCDMYIFTIFNIYLYNINLNKPYLSLKTNDRTDSCDKAIVKYYKGNIGILGQYYPNRKEMKKSKVKINFNNVYTTNSIKVNGSLTLEKYNVFNKWQGSRCFSTTTYFYASKVDKNNKDSNPISNNTNKNNYDSNYNLSLFLFTNIRNFLDSNPVNESTQLEVEKFLFNQYKLWDTYQQNKSHSILGIDVSKFSSKFKDYCLKLVGDFKVYLNKHKDYLNKNSKISDLSVVEKNSKVKLKDDIFIKDIFNTVHLDDMVNIMLITLFKVVTFEGVYDNDSDSDNQIPSSLTNNSINLGKDLCNLYIHSLYLKHKRDTKNPENYYSKFKTDLFNNTVYERVTNDEFLVLLGSRLMEIMFTCEVLKTKVIKPSKNESRLVLILDENISSLLPRKNVVITAPLKLPMIIKPKPYTENKLGGYLLNDDMYTEEMIIDKVAYKEKSKVLKDNIIYNTINNMSSTPFKVNKDLLEYLLINNSEHKLLISPDYVHMYENVKKRTKSQEKEYQSFLSKKILQEFVINIAQTYSNLSEIYFPVKLDNRGRIYATPSYFNYQGTELAKSLISFAIPGVISRNNQEAIEYLKAYGANCFGNGLDKKSYTKKIAWVDNNINNIINYHNSPLLELADDKFLFLAFCIEMSRFNKFLSQDSIHEFKTYLPIQLDGTCNGFQHLALLSNETEIFGKLNLLESTKDNDPEDFYKHIIEQLTIFMANRSQDPLYTKDWDSYNRLSKVSWTRANVKTAIMTKPYNAKEKTLVKYVRDTLIHVRDEPVTFKNSDGLDEIRNIGWYKIEGASDENLVNYYDVELLVKCMNDIIYIHYPKIKLLSDYLNDIAKLLNKLNLPIIWRLPSGLEVSQQYLVKNVRQIRPYTYLKTSITISVTDKLKTLKSKQILALMPNLVHSLDSTSLSLLYNAFYKEVSKDNVVNFYSVHDCFGVTANSVGLLINLLKTVYISIYSGKTYLEQFDKDILDNIKAAYGEDKCEYIETPKGRYIIINKTKHILPNITPLIKNTLEINNCYKSLRKSTFLIK